MQPSRRSSLRHERAGDVVTGVCERFHHVPMDGRVTALRLPYLLEQTEYLFQLGMPGDGFDSHTCKQGGLLGLADCLRIREGDTPPNG